MHTNKWVLLVSLVETAQPPQPKNTQDLKLRTKLAATPTRQQRGKSARAADWLPVDQG